MFIDTVQWNPQTALALVGTAARFGFTGIIFNIDVTPPSSALSIKKATTTAAVPLLTNPIRRVNVPVVDPGLVLSTTEFEQSGLVISSSSDHPLSGGQQRLGGDKRASRNSDPRLVTQISRVTVKISDPNQVGFLNSLSRSHQFDLVAVSPEEERAWTALLAQGEFDIVRIDLTSGRVPFPMRRHQLMQLVRRGISFDICLSGAIQDPTARRHLFTNIQQLVRFVPHDKLFLTSGADHPLGLRAPMDVANIAQLMGIRDKPQAVMGANAVGCIYKSGARRTAGGMVGVIAPLADMPCT